MPTKTKYAHICTALALALTAAAANAQPYTQEYAIDTAPIFISSQGSYRIHQITPQTASAYSITIDAADSITLTIEKLNVLTPASPITIKGRARVGLILMDTNILAASGNGQPCIHVMEHSRISIMGTGRLRASAGANAAAIGAGLNDTCGSISIYSGNITATADYSAIGMSRGGISFCRQINIMGGTTESSAPHGISAGRIFIAAGSIKTDSIISSDPFDPRNMANQQVFLAKLGGMAAVHSVLVDGTNFSISSNHNNNDTLYLYLQHATAADSQHQVRVLLHDGRFMNAIAKYKSLLYIFAFPTLPSAMNRYNTKIGILSQLEAPYKQSHESNPAFDAQVINLGTDAPSAPLNSAAFNEVVITLNGVEQYRRPITSNPTCSVTSALGITGLDVMNSPYSLTIEYGGNALYLPCRKDTTFAINKAVPYTPPEAEATRYAHLNQRLRQCTPALASGWQWVKPDSILNELGLHRFEAIYTPTDSDNFNPKTQALPVRVDKPLSPPPDTPPAIPVIYASYGAILDNIALPAGHCGRWYWLNPQQRIDTIGRTAIYTAYYQPCDTIQYSTPLSKPPMIISKAKPPVAAPQNLRVSYGELVSSVGLDTIYFGIDSQRGYWLWTAPWEKVGKLGLRQHPAVFLPSDTLHYDTLMRSLNIMVEKPAGFVQFIIDSAMKKDTNHYLINNCAIDTVLIRFSLPAGVKIYAAHIGDSITSYTLLTPRPDVYNVVFTVVTTDTDWIENLVVERRFAMKNIIYHKSGILFVNNNPATNAIRGTGYTFRNYRWYRNDTLMDKFNGSAYYHENGRLRAGALYHAALYTDTAQGIHRIIHTCPQSFDAQTLSARQVQIYPNPAPLGSMVSVTIPDDMKDIVLLVEIRIYDSMGALRSYQAIPADNPQLSLRPLEQQGVYFFETNIGNARVVVR
jgi:hypothetical protein